MSNADTKADLARGVNEDVPPLSSSRRIGHFIKWKRAKRHTALLHEAGYLLLGVQAATVNRPVFWLDAPPSHGVHLFGRTCPVVPLGNFPLF